MSIFYFQQFLVNQTQSAMKIGTDAMVFGALIQAEKASKALDIGTGTGVLSLMVAQRNPSIYIQAIEIEPKAFEEACFNFSSSPFSNQLSAIYQDFRTFKSDEPFDLIFTNPPYFTNSSKSVSEIRTKARHTDELPFEQLMSNVASLLAPQGHFWIILPPDAFEIICNLAIENNLHLVRQIAIFGKQNQLVRNVGVFSFEKQAITHDELILRNEDNSYTTSYISLTKEFHAVDLHKKSGR